MNVTAPHTERIRLLKVSLIHPQSPLLRKLIYDAIRLSETPGYIEKDIDILYDRIVAGWARIHQSLICKAYLFENMVFFHRFLTAILLMDYAKEPYTISPWVLTQAGIVMLHRAGDSCDDDLVSYPNRILFPLEQMMLNRDHVENRLLATISENSDNRGHVQSLIDKKNWSDLTTTIKNDRDLTISLFREELFYQRAVNITGRRKILKGIDKVQAKYLARLNPITDTHSRGGSTKGSAYSGGFVWNMLTTVKIGLRWTNSGLRPKGGKKEL